MHNGKVHDTGGPPPYQLVGDSSIISQIHGSIDVYSLSPIETNEIVMPPVLFQAFFKREDVEEYMPGLNTLEVGQLVSFNIVVIDDIPFAKNIRYESHFSAAHLNPLVGFSRVFATASFAATFVLFAISYLISGLFNSSIYLAPFISDFQLTTSNVILKIIFVTIIGILCQGWASQRNFKGGFKKGMQLGLYIGIVILCIRWNTAADINLIGSIIELLKLSFITGLIASVNGAILSLTHKVDVTGLFIHNHSEIEHAH